MPEATLHSRLRAFLAAHNTMTLATVGPDAAPYAAAVFYAADEDLRLFFLSSPNSRHSLAIEHDPRVAATIQADNQEWQEIQGIQIVGTAREVHGTAELAHATRIYAARFDFLAGLLDQSGSGPAALRGPLASSRFYVLQPTWIRLIDNTVGFGYKEEGKLVNGELVNW